MQHLRDRTQENVEARQKKMVEIHCPFNCERCDIHQESGYCCHLVGFTNDGKIFETIEPVILPVRDAQHNKTGENRYSGRFMVNGRKRARVMPSDVVVNPETVQKDEAGSHMMKAWVSSRVYRDCEEVEATVWRRKYSHPEDVELEESLIHEGIAEKRKRLAEELAALDDAESQPMESKKRLAKV